MAAKTVDFESSEYDGPEVLAEDALIDALEEQHDAVQQRQRAAEWQAAGLRHAVETCLASCLASIDMLYVSRDEAPISHKARAHGSWQQEAEPRPCSQDSWLRGVIPEEAAPAPQPTASTSAVAGAGSAQNTSRNVRHTSSVHSTMSGTGRRSFGATAAAAASGTGGTQEGGSTADGRASSAGRAPSAGRAGSPGGPRAVNGPSSRPGSQPSRAGTAASGAAAAAQGRTFKVFAADASAKKLSAEQQEAEDRLRDELALRRQQEATAKELKRKDEEARTKVAALQKELKGKEYSYDHRGQVVLLTKVNPESLPTQPTPNVRVQSPLPQGGPPAQPAPSNTRAPARRASETNGHSSGGARAGSPTPGGRSGSPTPGARRASNTGTHSGTSSSAHAHASNAHGHGATSAARDFIEAPSRAQPSALSTMKLGPGVTLRQGAAVKSGPKREGAGGQLTRTQYQHTAAAAKAQQEKTKRPKVALVPPPAAAAAAAAAATASSGGVAGPATASQPGQDGPTAANEQQQQSDGPAPPVSAILAAVPATAGSMPKGALNRDSSYKASKDGRPMSPDVNVVLVTAADWGQGTVGAFVPPAPVPIRKPGAKELKEEFGRTDYLPKTRASVATIKPPRQAGR